MTLFHTIWTILAMAIFVGIILWAWSSRRRTAFDEASRLPLDDEGTDSQVSMQGSTNEEKNHG